MASEKTAYWVAVAVMAVFLGNHFANKYEGGCLANRTMAAVQQLSGEANHFLAMGQVALGSTPRFVAPEIAMARVQSGFVSMQADIARQQAVCARLEAQRARLMALQQLRNMRVLCPRQKVGVSALRVPAGDATL